MFFKDTDVVKAIRPIYRTAAGEIKGKQFGDKFEKIHSERAKEGYAVGGVSVKWVASVETFRVTYQRVLASGRLDVNDYYTSSWIGAPHAKSPGAHLLSDGAQVIGVSCRMNDRDGFVGIALVKSSR